MALKAKKSDVTYFEKNNFPSLAKNGYSSSFLVIIPQFWALFRSFLGILRFCSDSNFRGHCEICFLIYKIRFSDI